MYHSVGEKLAGPLTGLKEWANADFSRSLSWDLFNSLMPKTWWRCWNVFIKLAVLLHPRGGHCSEGLQWAGGTGQQVPRGRQGTSARISNLTSKPRRTWKLWVTAGLSRASLSPVSAAFMGLDMSQLPSLAFLCLP